MTTPIEVGTPIWSNGFGCVTWVGTSSAGIAFLVNGEPKAMGFVPIEMVKFWVQRWIEICSEDGRIEDVLCYTRVEGDV